LDLCLFNNALSGADGVQRFIVNLLNAMAERGLAVTLVTAMRSDGPFRSLLSPGVGVVALGSLRTSLSVFKFAGYLRRRRPKALLTAQKQCDVTAIMARALVRSPVRHVISIHNTLSRQADSDVVRDNTIWPWLMRTLYPRTQADFVAVSQGVADDVAGFIGRPLANLRVIYNPIGVARPSGETLSVDRPFILAAGRLDRQKDFATLLRAFARLRAKRDMRLVILGEGPERGALEALAGNLGIAGHVELPGFSPHIHDYMRAAELFVLSSRFEGFGNVIVEAMACGARVVSAECPSGPAEILENGKWGRLVSVGDDAALAEAMLEALDDPTPPDARRRAKDFSVDRAADLYLDALGLPPYRCCPAALERG
jgi:glycosyltransferase involved in cell wall biosynthesis